MDSLWSGRDPDLRVDPEKEHRTGPTSAGAVPVRWISTPSKPAAIASRAAAAKSAIVRAISRSLLRATPAALDGVRFLRDFGRTGRERLVARLLTNASVGLLPHWARAGLGIHRPATVRSGWDRPVATAAGRALEWARGPSEIQAATRRRLMVVPPRDQ
ncbi:oxygenase MpaB family protein [Kitasatospora sp. NPDC052896]|uniref:oxygenase MpaB family protein n=1 Tax=Kitasatospora sp. NPDC052896 TaxID=3364061 RepID=UPI0037C529CC